MTVHLLRSNCIWLPKIKQSQIIIDMNNKWENMALEALCNINNDSFDNHDITSLLLPENGDKTMRICEDLTKNGKVMYYLLKLNEDGSQFVQYVQGDVPDIPPVGWKDI